MHENPDNAAKLNITHIVLKIIFYNEFLKQNNFFTILCELSNCYPVSCASKTYRLTLINTPRFEHSNLLKNSDITQRMHFKK